LTGLAKEIAAVYKALFGIEITELDEAGAEILLSNEYVQEAMRIVRQGGIIMKQPGTGFETLVLRGLSVGLIASLIAGTAGAAVAGGDTGAVQDAVHGLVAYVQSKDPATAAQVFIPANETELTIADFENWLSAIRTARARSNGCSPKRRAVLTDCVCQIFGPTNGPHTLSM
jgi:hypothetical protein